MGKVDLGSNWLFSGVVSVAIHVGILMAVLGLDAITGGGGAANPIPSAPVPETSEQLQESRTAEPEPINRESDPIMASPSPEKTVKTAEPPTKSAVEPKYAKKQVKAAELQNPVEKTIIYEVKKGDSLTSIAKSCGLTLSELAKLNGVPEKRLHKLFIGQKIKIRQNAQ